MTKRCNGNKSIFVLKSPFPITTCCDTGAYSTIPKEKERVVSFLILFFVCKQNIESDLSIEIDMIYGKILNPYDNNIIRIILFTLSFVSIGIFQRIIFMLIDGFLVGP